MLIGAIRLVIDRDISSFYEQNDMNDHTHGLILSRISMLLPTSRSYAHVARSGTLSICTSPLSCAKKRAPRALKEIKALAVKQMGTKDVRVDTTLNKFIWSRGIAHVPFRVRVRCERKRNEDEEAAERTYTLVSFVNVDSFKGMLFFFITLMAVLSPDMPRHLVRPITVSLLRLLCIHFGRLTIGCNRTLPLLLLF